MAELILKIRDGGSYRDGDLLAAVPWRAIRAEHASRLCSRHDLGNRNGGSLLKAASLAGIWMAETHRYRCERVSKHEVLRIVQEGWSLEHDMVGNEEPREVLLTGPQFDVTIGEHPERRVFWTEIHDRLKAVGGKTRTHALMLAAGEIGKLIGQVDWRTRTIEIDGKPLPFTMTLLDQKTCHVEEFFERRLRHKDRDGRPRHLVFGDDLDHAVYYCGRKDESHATLDRVWGEITSKTGLRDSDFPHLPLSMHALKKTLVLPAEDFDDDHAGELVAPLRTTEQIVVQAAVEVGVSQSADKNYRLTVDKPLAKIRQVETVTLDGKELQARPEQDGSWLAVSKTVPKLGTMTVSGVVKKRERFADWRAVVSSLKVKGVTIDDVLNRRKAIDVRGKVPPVAESILEAKVP